MTLSDWFQNQLRSTADGFIWAAEQMPPERRYIQPPSKLGGWTAARHVFHMAYYERNVALPSMHQWLGKPRISEDDLDADKEWSSGHTIESLVRTFQVVRNEQIALLTQFDEPVWHETRETGWGTVTLLWVVSKTFQHTAEHTNNVMRMALFWDIAAAQERGAE
ncbi:MAG: DinB family protein [Acidobacteriota bacterium]